MRLLCTCNLLSMLQEPAWTSLSLTVCLMYAALTLFRSIKCTPSFWEEGLRGQATDENLQ